MFASRQCTERPRPRSPLKPGLIPSWSKYAAVALVWAMTACPAAASAATDELTLSLDSGREVAVWLRNDAPSAMPQAAVILLGGFQRGGGAIDLVTTELPVIWVGMDYPYDPPRKFIFPGSLRHLPDFSTAVDETLEALLKLVARLRARPDVDADRIVIIGASAGAPFATIAAAQAQIPSVIIVQGFGNLSAVVAQQFILRWQPKYGDWVVRPAHWLARVLVWGLGLPQPERYAARYTADQRVLFIDAVQDERIPASATEALWQAIEATPAQADRHRLAGGHLSGAGDPLIDEIVRTGAQWMESNGLLRR